MEKSAHNLEQRQHLRQHLEVLALSYHAQPNPKLADRIVLALDPLVATKAMQCASKSSANSYCRRLEAADVAQVARLAIWKALSTWKPEKARFLTWAHHCVGNALRDLLDGARREPASLEIPANYTRAACDPDPLEARELQEALAKLPAREGQIVSEYYLEGRTIAEVALRIGLSEARVYQLRARALELLRAGFPSLDFDEGSNLR